MNAAEILAAITPVVEVFEGLGVAYYIGGSVASSVYGFIRATIDADLVADLQLEHVLPLVKQLEDDYYINADAVREAIRRLSSFNAIHLDTILKFTVFIPKSRPFDQEELRRIRQEVLAEGTRPFYMASPEDTILNKLEWYRMGGEVSTSQWNDILGVFKVQGTALDMAYMQRWAKALQVTDLLERALLEAGMS